MDLPWVDAGFVAEGDLFPILVGDAVCPVPVAQHPFLELIIRSADRLPVNIAVTFIVIALVVAVYLVNVIRCV